MITVRPTSISSLSRPTGVVRNPSRPAAMFGGWGPKIGA
jgi:hypothetical protein